jgi:hypothetical protein
MTNMTFTPRPFIGRTQTREEELVTSCFKMYERLPFEERQHVLSYLCGYVGPLKGRKLMDHGFRVVRLRRAGKDKILAHLHSLLGKGKVSMSQIQRNYSTMMQDIAG